MEIGINEVKFRKDLYPRIDTDTVKVKEYAETLDLLPPIEVDQNNELIDGWHRWTAHKKANRETMAKLCLSLIIVEPDAVQRADLEKVFPHLEHAFGAPQTAAETQQEAQFLAARLLVSN